MKKVKDCILEQVRFSVIIHTMQGKSGTVALEETEIRRKPYVRRFHIRGGKAIYQVNPNKCGIEIHCLADTQRAIDYIVNDLCLGDFSISRLDVAIDTLTPYDHIYKINGYLKELYAVYLNEGNSYRTIGDDLKKRSLKVSNHKYELEIYNKLLESGGRDPANTRIEFRFKRLNGRKEIADLIRELCRVLDRLPLCIDMLNRKKADELYTQFLLEQAPEYEGRITSFPAFVSKYADYFYNMDILRGVFAKEHSGQCKNWLYRYRTSGKTLTLYSKGELLTYISTIKRALNEYVKSDPAPSLFAVKNGVAEEAQTLMLSGETPSRALRKASNS